MVPRKQKSFRLLKNRDGKTFFKNEEKGFEKMAQKIVYNHKAVEKKWRENWEKNPVNPQFDDNGNKKQKYYCLDMFPYPSGN